MREIVTYWHGPIAAADGMMEAELGTTPLPYPLRWWYGWAGRQSEIMSGQNFLLKPQDAIRPLEVGDDGRLLFCTENQNVYDWATLRSGDDPPVFGRYSGSDQWEPEGVTLSEHLILACLSEATMSATYGATAAWLADAVVAAIAEVVPPIAIGPWRWGNTRFHAKAGAFMFVMPNGEMKGKSGVSVWLGAKTEHPLQFLKPYLNDEDWEYVAI